VAFLCGHRDGVVDGEFERQRELRRVRRWMPELRDLEGVVPVGGGRGLVVEDGVGDVGRDSAAVCWVSALVWMMR
jgi:hypothetical protein